MKNIVTTILFSVLSLMLITAGAAHAQWYVGSEVGAGLSPGVTFDGTSNDRSSVCDEYINPQYASVPGCTDPDRGASDGWTIPFESATGLLGNMSVGYQMKPWLRLEVELAVWHARHDDAVILSGGDATGADQDKLTQEVFLARERLDSFTSRGGYVNAYVDRMLAFRDIGLYAGVGVGLAAARAGYSSLWARNKNVDEIKTGLDQPNADEIRQNLAGTVSSAVSTLKSNTPVIQILVGIDRHVTDRMSIGLKARYATHLNFDSNQDLVWDPLRNHAPNIRRNGSEPVSGDMSTSDFSAITFGIHVKHRL